MPYTAGVTVSLDRTLGTISPNLYGTTWDWRDSASGGIWVGEDASMPQIDGFRTDAIEALRARHLPVVQFFPQSPFYDWEDGVGPRERRPKQLLPWGRIRGHEPSEVSNDVGTDEFIRFCRLLGAEPFLDTNESDPVGSRNWVEYCNCAGDSRYARMRADNGHPEPYAVKYWHVYAWGDMDAETHARDFRKFASVARLIDPRIQVVGSAVGGARWASTVFETLDRVSTPAMGGIGLIDHMAFVHYFGVLAEDVDYTDAEYYRILRNTEGLDSRLQEYDAMLRFYSERRTPWARNWLDESFRDQVSTPDTMGMVMTEWAVNWASRRCTMRDAIAAAGVMDTYHRWADRVHMAFGYALTCGQALLQTDADSIWVTPTYHLFEMYKPHRNNESLAVEVKCEQLATDQSGGETDFFASATVERDRPLPVLSASASIEPDRSEMIVSVTNRHLSESIEVDITLDGAEQAKSGTQTLLSSDLVRDYNGTGYPERIKPLESHCTPTENRCVLELPPYSVSAVRLKFRR